MKKKVCLALAAVMACSVALGATACGGESEPETPGVDAQAPAFSKADATIALSGGVDREDPFMGISPDLFGLFLEDINYASYAMDDNMVVNGSFEYASNRTYGWNAAGGAGITVQSGTGIHVNNPYYIKVSSPANGSISNAGYEALPMFLDFDVDYVFSAFIRNYAGALTVRVKSARGSEVYLEKTVDIAESANWVKYEVTINSQRITQEDVVLELVFGSATQTCELDAITFETKDATGGIKNYVFNAIKDLSPAFFRFPGGCAAEGTNDNNWYNWKSSIGAEKVNGDDELNPFTYTLNRDGQVEEVTTYGEQATRVPNTNIWQRSGNYYEMEYGVGFYEYFLLCENVGAKAIPIVSCGMTCQTQGSGTALRGRHGNGIQDFIQDAKDLICFAKGSVNATDPNERYWAQVRANMGHPEPFAMDYIGIGNEQWGYDYFVSYYEKFLEAFAEEENPIYRSVKPIVGNCTLFQNCENPADKRKGEAQVYAEMYYESGKIARVADYGLHDQHYYVNYTDFFENAYLYDDYKRPQDAPETYYEVFVGEYSANAQVRRSPTANDNVTYTEYFRSGAPDMHNTWMTAISEAAMMTGFERNGDIVKLAAYAPMFGIVWDRGMTNYNQWFEDMMYLTNFEVVLTPNYFVQQLFMQNAGDYKLTSLLTFAGETPKSLYRANNSAYDRTLDDVYYVTSYDSATGDVLVKIVNAGDSALKFNVDLTAVTGLEVQGAAQAIVLANSDPLAVSTLSDGNAITPSMKTLGISSVFGYEAPAYSVTALRVKTK